MHRTLERLDAAASTIVPLLYLVGLALGVVSYFTGLTVGLGIAVGFGLACAAELHSFLQQRRVRASFALLSRLTRDDPRRGALLWQFAVSAGILAFLILFSTYNAIAFVAATWRPSPGFLPVPVQIAIRGCVVPLLFFLSGFLVPLQADAGTLLASASHQMLHKAITATVKQWRRRINKAARDGHDLAPVAVALMQDHGDLDGARRVQLIADGLNAAERGTPFSYLPTGAESRVVEGVAIGPMPAPVAVFEADPPAIDDQTLRTLAASPTRPPTGPGSPAPSKPRRPKRRARRTDVLHLTPPTPEMRARDVLAEHPSASIAQLAKWAHIGLSAASKWRGIWLAEQAERRQNAGEDDEAAG